MDSSDKIIQAIKDQEIQPTPKWIFTSKKILTWVAFSLTVVFGALAFSVILFVIQQSDFDMLSHLDHSKLELFLGLLPIIWLVFVIIFLGLAILSIRNSWKGYKFSVLKQAGISMAISIALGTLLFLVGGGKWIEHAYNVNIESYESLEERKIQVWSKPEEGYLSGSIVAVSENVITLKDFKEQEWEINIEDSFIAPVVMLERGEIIKLMGEMKSQNKFISSEIRPWGGRRNGPRRNINN